MENSNESRDIYTKKVVITFVDWIEDSMWWRDDDDKKWYNSVDEKGKIGLTTEELYEEFWWYQATLKF